MHWVRSAAERINGGQEGHRGAFPGETGSPRAMAVLRCLFDMEPSCELDSLANSRGKRLLPYMDV